MTKKRNTIVGVTDSSYKKFLENVELYALGLDSLSANLRRYDYGEASKFTNNIKSSFIVSEFDTDHFDITARLVLTVGENPDNPLLRIDIEYSAHFHPASGEFEQHYAERFAEVEARLIFWPYFRQTVSDVTARMHIRPLTIPLNI